MKRIVICADGTWNIRDQLDRKGVLGIRVLWFERGVGVVREEATTESQLKLPDGQSARISTMTTMRLVEHAFAE